MSGAGREGKLQRINSVFPGAARKAGLTPEFKLEFLSEPYGAAIAVSSNDPRKEPLHIRFDVRADNGVVAASRDEQTAVGGLYDERIEEYVANAIKNAVAKHFG